MKSPVSSISIAGLRGTLRESATIGVEQNRPYLTPEVAKRALVVASARSQAATSWQPAAVAMPSTSAITGCGSRVSESIILLHAPNSSTSLRALALARHLLEIVPGAERPARAGDHHHAHGRVVLDRVELGLQLGQQLARERVVLVRPVEGQADHALRRRCATAPARPRARASITASSMSAASAIALSPDPRASSGESYIGRARRRKSWRTVGGRARRQPCAAATRCAFQASITRFECPRPRRVPRPVAAAPAWAGCRVRWRRRQQTRALQVTQRRARAPRAGSPGPPGRPRARRL